MIPLKSLHPDEQLLKLKLELFRTWTTDEIVRSLKPGMESSLKTRPNGTILDGNHRIKILRERVYNVDDLPREIILKHELDS